MNRSAKIKRWSGAFLAFAALLAAVIFSAPTFAAGISKDSLVEKAALTGLYRCYLSGNMRKTIDIDKYTGPSYLYTGDAQFKVAMPSGYTDRNLLTCTQILDGVRDRNKGANAYGGLATTAGALSTLTTPDAKARFLTGMGYQLESGSSEESQSCAIFTYDTTIDPADFRQDTVSSVNTTTVCLKTADGKIDSDRPTVTHSSSINNGQVTQDDRNSGLQFVAGKNKVTCQFAGDNNKTEVKFKVGDTWQSFYDSILTNGCAKDSATYVSAGGGLVTQQRREPQNNPGGNAASTYEFLSDKKETAAESAIRTLSNNSYRNYAAVALNQEEKVILLQTYLEGFYQISNKGCDLTGDSLSLAQGDGYKAARIFDKESNSFKSCYVKAERNADSKVYVWDDTDHINRDNQMTFDEVLNALNGFTITALSDPSAIGDITSATEDPADVSSTTACFANAGPLGWIACPVLDAVGGLAETLYGFIETNFLQLDSSLTTTEGVRSGWRQFRDFANILFAIVFIIVILAQVTGVGISNYNIKKILPRLIMVVILVNVSFILCQLAVDVSNIVGYSIRGLFDGFAQTAANAVTDPITGEPGIPFNFMDVFSGVIGAASSTAAIAGIVAVFAIKIPWELWLFPIILAVIGCLISIFFFLIILGVRQAGVVVLIALAPVAIVCYALPNTKTVFDKWRKMLVGLLLVYPICGLLMGGGQFASTLLLLVGHEGDVGAFFTIVAMLVSVVPFFFIPSILRNSMTAMGNLGAKISQFGKNFSGGITRGIRSSEWGKNFQRQRQMSYDLKASQKLQKKQTKREAVGKKLGRGASRRLFLHTSAYNRAMSEDIRAGGGQELLAPGTPAYEAAQANATNTQLADDTKARRSVYESTLNTGNAAAMGVEYGKALENLHANPKDRNALVNVRALQDILSETDDGRGQVQSQINRVLNNHRDFYSSAAAKTQDSALSQAARHLSSAYGGQYKKTNRGTFAMINDFTNKDFSHAFEQSEDGTQHSISEQNGMARSSYYDQAGMTNYTAQTLPEADEGALQGISNTLDGMAELEKNGVTLSENSAMQRSKIVATAGDALGNANIHMKPKVAEQLQSMVIKGNSAQTIGGTNVGALNRMAESIEQHTMGAAEQAQLVSMAQAALSGGHVTNTEKAAALNHILAAAGQPTIDISQPVNGAADVDSGSIPVPHEDSAPTPSPARARPASDEIFTINPDGTISGGVKPFTISNGRLTDSGIILPPERPNRARPGSRSSKPGQNGGEGTT